jgi:DNA-binding transcriptional LysR family regulator
VRGEQILDEAFSKAADLLRLPKSTVSRTISHLEEVTGTKLLVRTTRSLTPTAAGLALFESASGAVQQLEDATRSIQGKDSVVAGTLRLTAPEDLGAHIISPVIAKLSRQYPELSFELNYTDEIVDLVREGYDFAIRLGKLAPSRFKVKKLGEVVVVPVAAPGYLEENEKIRQPQDLAKHDCLVYRSESSRPKWTLHSGRQVVQVAIQPKIAANMMSSLLSMAKQSAGVAFIPKYLCQKELMAGELVRVLPGWEEAGLPVHIVSPLGTGATGKLKIVASSLTSGIESALR